MTRDLHRQARELIACGGLTDSQQAWLRTHMQDCDLCREYAQAADQVVRSLHSVPVAAGRSLVRATQMRVRTRAQELQRRQERLWLVWMSCAVVGLSAAITTPLLWRGFQWAGEFVQVSNLVLQVGFAVFWITPALTAGVLLVARGTHLMEGNGKPQG
jgi:predicted anti-sigma-YlaC factor YlaD